MIFETALGGSIESEAKEEKIRMIATLLRLIRLVEERMAKPWLAFDWLHYLSSGGRESRKLIKVGSTLTTYLLYTFLRILSMNLNTYKNEIFALSSCLTSNWSPRIDIYIPPLEVPELKVTTGRLVSVWKQEQILYHLLRQQKASTPMVFKNEIIVRNRISHGIQSLGKWNYSTYGRPLLLLYM